MATFKNFEDIEAWQAARELTRAVYRITKTGAFSRDFVLRDQIRRAAISGMSNIAEGFDRGSNREFAYHLSVAAGSVAEVRSQLYVALDEGYISELECKTLGMCTTSTTRMLYGLIRYLDQPHVSRERNRPRVRR